MSEALELLRWDREALLDRLLKVYEKRMASLVGAGMIYGPGIVQAVVRELGTDPDVVIPEVRRRVGFVA